MKFLTLLFFFLKKKVIVYIFLLIIAGNSGKSINEEEILWPIVFKYQHFSDFRVNISLFLKCTEDLQELKEATNSSYQHIIYEIGTYKSRLEDKIFSWGNNWLGATDTFWVAMSSFAVFISRQRNELMASILPKCVDFGGCYRKRGPQSPLAQASQKENPAG